MFLFPIPNSSAHRLCIRLQWGSCGSLGHVLWQLCTWPWRVWRWGGQSWGHERINGWPVRREHDHCVGQLLWRDSVHSGYGEQFVLTLLCLSSHYPSELDGGWFMIIIVSLCSLAMVSGRLALLWISRLIFGGLAYSRYVQCTPQGKFKACLEGMFWVWPVVTSKLLASFPFHIKKKICTEPKVCWGEHWHVCLLVFAC